MRENPSVTRQSPHPFAGVAIVGVHNTVQARVLPEHDSTSIALVGALGALADAGISPREVDGVVGTDCAQIVLELGLGPCTRRPSQMGIPALLDAAALITTGQCEVVLIAAGGAGVHVGSVLDGALDTAGQRARRRLRAVHRGRIRAHGTTAHAHLRHHAGADGRRRPP